MTATLWVSQSVESMTWVTHLCLTVGVVHEIEWYWHTFICLYRSDCPQSTQPTVFSSASEWPDCVSVSHDTGILAFNLKIQVKFISFQVPFSVFDYWNSQILKMVFNQCLQILEIVFDYFYFICISNQIHRSIHSIVVDLLPQEYPKIKHWLKIV